MAPIGLKPWVKDRKGPYWLVLAVIASAFLLAGSGICIRQLSDVPSGWLILSWLLAFFWLFLLVRLRVFSGPRRFLFLVGTTVALNLMAQSTGGEDSPLTLAVFLLMGIAAWEGDALFGFWVALLFSSLELAYSRREESALGLSLYLRWAAFLVSAFFLARIVRTRKEKERLDQHLESLKNEAEHLASNAEPSSFNVPKDKLLMEEKRLSARIGTLMELEDSLAQQLALFQRSVPVHSALFFFLTVLEDKKVLRLRAFSSDSPTVAADVTLLPGETLVGLAAKEGRQVLLNQLAPESAKALPYYLKPNAIGSFLALPVYLKNNPGDGASEEVEWVGVLVLDHLQADFFTPEKVSLAESLGRLLAETVHGSRIVHFSKTKTRNLHALYEVSRSFSTLLDINDILKTALNTAREISVCDSAYIALAENEGRFGIKAWWGHSRGLERAEFLEDELASWLLENKKAIRYTRGQKDRNMAAFSRREGMLGSIQSFLMVPLIIDGDVWGVIRVNSQKPDSYQDYDQDVLTTLANQTAMALKNYWDVKQINEMAVKDGLTGVYNHRYFQEKLAEEMAKAERYNKDLSLALLDVDHFKKFNDNYGHQEGDRVLRVVAETVQKAVRQKVDMVARYGGEEFAVILPEADGNAGMDLGERIRKGIEAHLFENGEKTVYRVTVSIGISSYPFDGREPKTLIQSADRALYACKAAGRNRVRRFTASDQP